MTLVITGLGMVSPVGEGPEAYWQGLLAGVSAPQPITDRPGIPDSHAYRVARADADGSTRDDRRPRCLDLARSAVRQALAGAGLGDTRDSALHVGLFLGTGTGDGEAAEQVRDGRRSAGTDTWWAYGGAARLGDELELTGPVQTVSTACAAGAYAVALAAQSVLRGEADVALAGGAEVVSRPALAAFLRLGAVDPVHCRPFDAKRQGTVYGEGAAFLVLESAEHARARSARPLATVDAGGWSCDGHHLTAPAADGRQAARAGREALRRAGVLPEQIAAVVCHGTGTPLNDRTESRVMTELLGPRAATTPVTAVKSVLGHSGGAAGAFSCATAALVVAHRRLPPVANLDVRDVECRLAISSSPQPVGSGSVLLNAYAFGGNNISLVIGPVS
ncbi:beta-ketoacyl-[acyl-carrier-protein] synthase family protein [Streptacidiphilus neutrinimicus]|uniref:beta-ketoacyl-[acyl-carrier-protein] synthase family protein n=1 Tax=Streptacidiphilus neutrinimicus TaxID=105420 RepID=UPI0005AAA7D9|nr:beta-ketoacyl-[acyl-carrier-protein] synthase family protein [Streptacidiphilus neutrinimicus]